MPAAHAWVMNLPAPARVLSPTPRRTSPASLGVSSAMVGTSMHLRARRTAAAQSTACHFASLVCKASPRVKTAALAVHEPTRAAFKTSDKGFPSAMAACSRQRHANSQRRQWQGPAERWGGSGLAVRCHLGPPGTEVERFTGGAALRRGHARPLQPASIQPQPLGMHLHVVEPRVLHAAAGRQCTSERPSGDFKVVAACAPVGSRTETPTAHASTPRQAPTSTGLQPTSGRTKQQDQAAGPSTPQWRPHLKPSSIAGTSSAMCGRSSSGPAAAASLQTVSSDSSRTSATAEGRPAGRGEHW